MRVSLFIYNKIITPQKYKPEMKITTIKKESAYGNLMPGDPYDVE